jgi:anhydro-N-acetylmuramic acid kinase
MFQRLSAKEDRIVAGLMSGTSGDGIDVALARIKGAGESAVIEVMAFDTLKFSPQVRDRILAAQGATTAGPREVVLLSSYLGELYAHAISHICKKASHPIQEVDVVGCHGQTLYHHPHAEKFPGFAVNGSLQIGNAAILAERTGITVVSDFRSRDMAAGGQGAPLAPILDFVLFNHRARGRIILNIGGIANLTALPPDAPLDAIVAFDTGPGNSLVDLAVSHFTQGKQTFDKDGGWARTGKASEPLLEHLLSHPYFKLPPPKSLDRQEFGRPFLAKVLEWAPKMAPADLVATLTLFTVRTIAGSIMEHLLQKGRYEEILLGGGGALNPVMVEGLKASFPRMAVISTDEYHMPARAKEAILIAYLANETIGGRPANVPSATGARRPVILGTITPGANALDPA